MLTNPNTGGLFESEVLEIAKVVHAGAMLYYDGANLNAIVGVTNPGRMGFDVAHLNLHKTFATPHGGGGPGRACSPPASASPPTCRSRGLAEGAQRISWTTTARSRSGRSRRPTGTSAWMCGRTRTSSTTERRGSRTLPGVRVLNSNYLAHELSGTLPKPFRPLVKHEFVLSGAPLKARGVRTLDLAKRLLDEGIHAADDLLPLARRRRPS